jgi:hypothetical protein
MATDLLKDINPDAKPWYTSKTIWFNTLLFVTTIAARAFPDAIPLSNAEVDTIATALATIGNIYLRSITNKALKK